MELHQPYTGIVVQAVGVPSKFATMVKASDHDGLVEKYLKIKELTDKKEKVPKDLRLSKAETIIAENLLRKREEERRMRKKKDDGPRLDEWQAQAIDHILHGRSVAIFGPTSGGKTYLVKYAINEIRNHVRRAIFVAPTFHLALQTYADIQATYTGFPASLITDKMNEHHRESWIYVGTAECLLNFLTHTGEKFEIGIFDEVHSLNQDTFTDAKRIEATHSLMAMCNRQVVALSATVAPDDIPRVVGYLQDRCRIAEVIPITYSQRAVPQHVYIHNGKGIVPLEKLKSRTMAAPNYSPAAMFKLILTMRAFGMFPTLLFGMQNMSFQAFVDLITHIEQEEAKEYARYHRAARSINPFIEEYNKAVSEFREKTGANTLSKESQKVCEQLLQHRETLLVSVLEKVKDEIRASHTIVEEADEVPYAVPLPEWNKGVHVEGVDWSDEDYVPSVELVDLCDLFKCYDTSLDLRPLVPEPLPYVPETKGSFFRFGSNTHHVFNDMREGRKTEQIDKFKGVMTKMAEAEGLSERQMWKFVDFIGRGLDFGICALLKEFPFFIQYQILEMMKDKSLAAIFASESMSMGINYPLRSVVVFSPELIDVPVSHLLQMAGRCGRRGLDKKSFVVFWGIRNALDAAVETISFPDEDYDLPHVSGTTLLLCPKDEIQACYTRYFSTYSEEDRTALRKLYKDKCVDEYRAAYNL